jgi:8-oxo-dGTP diphosphatase
MSSKILAKVKTLVLVFDHTHAHIALISESEDKDHWKGSFNAIGGHVEQGEDIYTSAQRECKEELGINANLQLRLLAIMHVQDKKGGTNMMYAFTTIINKKTQLPGSDEGEIKWALISELPHNPNVVQDIKLFVRAAKALTGSEYITGTSRYKHDGTLEYIQICKRSLI